MNQFAHSEGSQSQRSAWSPGRIASVVTGLAVLLLGLALALIGGTVLAQQQDGAIDLGAGEYHGDGYAVASAPLDWSSESYLGADIEQASFEVTAPDAAPLFLGMTTPEEAEQYLTGEERAVDEGHRFDYTEHSGTSPDVGPDAVDIWSAGEEGAGSAELSFSTAEQQGERVLLIMRTDGEELGQTTVASHGVAPAARMIAIGALSAGAVIAAGAVVLVLVAFRRVRAAKRGTAGP